MTASRIGLLIIMSLGSLIAAAEAQRSATVAEVQALLQASQAADITAQVGPIAAQQLILALHRANPNLSPRADAVVTETVVSYLREQADRDRIVDKLVSIYTQHLTQEDVRQITEFYRSPAGQKLASVTPKISLESAKVGQEWMESILPGLQTELLARLRSEKLIR